MKKAKKIRQSKKQKTIKKIALLLQQHLEAMSNRTKKTRVFLRKRKSLRYLRTLWTMGKVEISQIMTKVHQISVAMKSRKKVRTSHQRRLRKSRQRMQSRQRRKSSLSQVRKKAAKERLGMGMRNLLRIVQLPGKMKKLLWLTRQKSLMMKNKRKLRQNKRRPRLPPPTTQLLSITVRLLKLWLLRNRVLRQRQMIKS